MAEAAISLGSNLGDKAGNIRGALRHLTADGEIVLRASSGLFRTEPWGDVEQDWFLNACALIETDLPPLALLDRCLAAETALGRDRSRSRRWGPREIDLDLLFYGDVELSDPRLTLPHPRLFERAFVLVPLAEIAGDRLIGGRLIAEAAGELGAVGIAPWPEIS